MIKMSYKRIDGKGMKNQVIMKKGTKKLQNRKGQKAKGKL
jgi:hypothetical protein